MLRQVYIYIDLDGVENGIENTGKDAKLKVCFHVRISNNKILASKCPPDSSEEVFCNKIKSKYFTVQICNRKS